MKVRWTPEARNDRADIWDYLSTHDVNAAVRIDELFSKSIAQLADYPMIGHEGEVAGTREITPHPSYRLVYEIFGEAIWILTIVHTKRQWPPSRN